MKTNFSFKKHQREVAKKKKKEEKAKIKLERKNALIAGTDSQPVVEPDSPSSAI